ncbi:MAG: hypothetical protein IJP38_09650 [Oscillospiraceae bacterium]|nr:hypothetical protein [Oscillospiraceae bacterium]
MKKLLSLALALLLSSMLLAACSPADDTPPAELVTFSSENGYELAYPSDLEPTSFSKEIDFVVMDSHSGTTVTVQSSAKQSGITDISEKAFAEMVAAEGMADIDISAFEKREQNGIPALVVMYTYNENEITRVIYDAPDKTYLATYTELPGTVDRIRAGFIPIIYSLSLDSSK